MVLETRHKRVLAHHQLFYSEQIPVRLWFLAKYKSADPKRGFRDRRLITGPGHSVS